MSNTPVVHRLFVKAAKGDAMRATASIDLVARRGVAGDANADERSPRQVLLVSEESLRRLRAAPGDLRENICVTGLPVDDLPSGTTLQIGTAELRITFPCDPCALLRRYAGIEPSRVTGARGMLAVVIDGGTAAVGGTIVDQGVRYEPLPADWHDRVTWFLQRLPAGHVMTYGDLAAAVGQVASVARVLPRLLVGPAYAGLPVDRVLTAAQLAEHPAAQRWAYWQLLYVRSTAGQATWISLA